MLKLGLVTLMLFSQVSIAKSVQGVGPKNDECNPELFTECDGCKLKCANLGQQKRVNTKAGLSDASAKPKTTTRSQGTNQ